MTEQRTERDRDREREAIAQIARTGVCYMSPGTLAAYRHALSEWERTREMFRGVTLPARHGFGDLAAVQVVVKDYLPDGKVFSPLDYLNGVSIEALLDDGQHQTGLGLDG